ncbi:hypothetical protein I553_4410 [Mycobacterium xenopi 4042]|uniref:Phage-related replication protein n=1 Tax=Mycobacterium xenopi 4042 TaxID=1299334 RepID=X8AF48_MYCXE|nr:hypothetical protein I553_4410 [Mycobacterium xenopi 4042]
MPQSFSELLSDPGVIEVSRLRSRFGFLAIHGGGLEQMTDVIAQRAADAAGASLYLVRHPQRYPHHLSSVRFRPDESPRLAEFLGHVDVAVSLHGYARFGRSTQLLAGGRNRALAIHLARHLNLPVTRSSPNCMPSRASFAVCIRTTRSTGCATAEPSWSCRRGCAASARAVHARTTMQAQTAREGAGT